MTRLYENRNIWRRTVGLVAFLIIVILYGFWELWRAQGSTDATGGATFGVLFVGGGIYALYQLYSDYRDLVASLDRDAATGVLAASVWQPTGPLLLTSADGAFSNWRSHVKVVSRTNRQFFIYADHSRHPRPLRFEIRPKTDLTGLRTVAPEAIAEFEAAAGIKPPAPAAK